MNGKERVTTHPSSRKSTAYHLVRTALDSPVPSLGNTNCAHHAFSTLCPGTQGFHKTHLPSTLVRSEVIACARILLLKNTAV